MFSDRIEVLFLKVPNFWNLRFCCEFTLIVKNWYRFLLMVLDLSKIVAPRTWCSSFSIYDLQTISLWDYVEISFIARIYVFPGESFTKSCRGDVSLKGRIHVATLPVMKHSSSMGLLGEVIRQMTGKTTLDSLGNRWRRKEMTPSWTDRPTHRPAWQWQILMTE